jgi:hypothetical protein
MSEKIQEALSKLDVKNDNHWTAEGLPRLDTVKMFANDPALTREAVSAAAPGFTRAGVQAAPPVPAPVVAPPVPDAPPAAPQAVAPEVVPTGGAAPPVLAGAPVDKGTDVLDKVVVTTQDLLADAQAELSELAVIKAQVEAQYSAKLKQVDALIVQAEQEKTGDTNAQAIKEYLARQVQIGQERARRMEALKGIDLKAILPTKAPIDAALNGRKLRGAQRPVRGV